jgi:aminopeptidase N
MRHLLWLTALGLIGASGATAQATGVSEPFFPDSGNRGYDVSHYNVQLAYQPSSGQVRATATIEAAASKRLGHFSLDLDGMRVTAVTVDGIRAAFTHGGGKLKIAPNQAPAPGQPFTAVVNYRGKPHVVVDADGTREGWERTGDGAVGLGEPLGTATWLPCDNTLADKASFSFEITVPQRLKGVANGRLLGVSREGGSKTFSWSEAQPMNTYLAVIDIGRGKLVRSEAAGLPAWTMVDPHLAERSGPVLKALPEIIDFESGVFGPYPFDAAGSIVDVAKRGYALETQTRPIYSGAPDRTTVVHETAHQWFGDSVGLRSWPAIWLNEGFATWAEWYYAEHHDGPSALRTFRGYYRVPAAKDALWDPPPGNPGEPKYLFAPSTYLRGAMALEALRIKVGTPAMLKTLRRWATAHRYGSADIQQFIALAEEVSGQPLGPLFQRWLYKPGKP